MSCQDLRHADHIYRCFEELGNLLQDVTDNFLCVNVSKVFATKQVIRGREDWSSVIPSRSYQPANLGPPI